MSEATEEERRQQQIHDVGVFRLWKLIIHFCDKDSFNIYIAN